MPFQKGHPQYNNALEIWRKNGGTNKGKKFSESHKKNLQIAHKGQHSSPKTEFKVGHKSRLGMKHTKETKNKLSKYFKDNPTRGFLGKHHTKESNKKNSEVHKGEKSPVWKGGIAYLPYSTDWNETLKRAIRERDNYICKLCNQYGNTIHHTDYDKKNCNPENLINLCKKCNSKVNFNRNYWQNYFNKLKL